MVTVAQFRKLALALPESVEASHFEQPDFRVRGKIFASLEGDGGCVTLKLAPELQAMLLGAKPKAFEPAAGYWGRQGWTRVQLKAVAAGELAELVKEAWLRVAPKRLAAAGQASAESGSARRPKPARAAKAGKKR